MKTSIEITIHPDGSLKIDALGFKGADCERATRFLEEALGQAVERQRKPGYHQARRTHNPQHLGS